jgi:succinate dehydrogenase / fumarate reductase membrane anchor subunit
MEYRTPLSRVLHLGSAHSGAGHFWRQRLTGAANVPLVLATLFIVIATVGRPYPEVIALLGAPWVAVALILLFVSVAIHMRLGMQVVIEDYVHGEALKVVLLAASTFFCVGVAALAILSVVTLAVGAIHG